MPVRVANFPVRLLVALVCVVTMSGALGQVSSGGLSVRGQVRPSQFATLSAGVARTITGIFVKPGDAFARGDLLLQFDCREEAAEKEMIEARLRAATARLDVNSKLEAFANVSKLDVELSRAELALASAEIKKIEVVLDKCEVRAPFSGTVVEKVAQSHQFAALGEPLLRIVDSNNLEVEAVLPSTTLSWLQPGFQFSLLVDETGDVVPVVLDRLVKEVDPVSQTLHIYGKLLDQPASLLPGMSGRLQFNHP